MARQNVYDDPGFFAGYQDLRERDAGINTAIEQPALRARLPQVSGLDVLDIGCGDGALCRDLVGRGASSALGVDPSERMLELAAARTHDPRIHYRRAFAEDLRLERESVDLVVSSLALHYVEDLDTLLGTVSSWLRPDGVIVASMEHPVVTAAPGGVPGLVDRYAAEGRRDAPWFDTGVIKYHRRVATVLNAVIGAGLRIDGVDEPAPDSAAVAARPELAVHDRRPSILVISARKGT